MRDHERHGKLQVLYVFEYELDDRKSLIIVEEELEFPLENSYTLLEALHDSTTLEPIYEESVTLLRQMHNHTLMAPSHDENFVLSNPLGEFFLYPTSHTSIFCNIHPN